MKNGALLLVLLLFMAVDVRAMSRAEANDLVAQAENAYVTDDPAAALLLFDSVRTEFVSAGLYMNIGNCHFKLGNVPGAILFYERALRLEPGAEDVTANLELARQQLADRVNELPGFAFGSTWGRVRGGRDVDQWARRALWACLAMFIALAVARLMTSQPLKRLFLGIGAILLVLTITSVVFASVRHAELTDDSEAIIMSAKVDVRSEPKEGGTVLFILHKGTKVSIQQERGEWSEVELPSGSLGWMPRTSLERI